MHLHLAQRRGIGKTSTRELDDRGLRRCTKWHETGDRAVTIRDDHLLTATHDLHIMAQPGLEMGSRRRLHSKKHTLLYISGQ